MYLNVVYAPKGTGIFPADFQPHSKSVVCPDGVDLELFAEEFVDGIFSEFEDFCFGRNFSESPDCSALMVHFPDHFEFVENRRIRDEVGGFYQSAVNGDIFAVARHFVPNARRVELKTFARYCQFGGSFVSLEMFIKLLRELHHNSQVLMRANV